jgi:hypothetical protein
MRLYPPVGKIQLNLLPVSKKSRAFPYQFVGRKDRISPLRDEKVLFLTAPLQLGA